MRISNMYNMASGFNDLEGILSGSPQGERNNGQRRLLRSCQQNSPAGQLGPFFAILALALVATSAQAASPARETIRIKNRKAELIEYTRHYEEKMGLEPMVIDFLPVMDHDKLCGKNMFTAWVGENGIENRPSIMYSTSFACQRTYSADDIARHETCHWRLQHAYMGFTKEKEEEEVKTCMGWYKNKNSKRKTILQVLAFVLLF